MIEENLRIKLAKLENKRNRLLDKIYSLDEQIDSVRTELQYGRDPYVDGPGVYVVSVNSNYKIGYASDVAARLSDLQVGNPLKLRLAIFIPCSIERAARLEKRLQKKFHMKNKRGEWFRLNRQDLKEIITAGQEICISGIFQWIFRPDELKAETIPYTDTPRDTVLHAIRLVCGGEGNYAQREAVIDQCKLLGLERSVAEELITQLRRNGDVFEPRPGLLKVY